MTQQEFAETIKVAPATLSSIFTGRTAPSLKIVEAIKSRFPDISTDWLMFGRGAMTDYRSEEAGASFGIPGDAAGHEALDFDGGTATPTVAPSGHDAPMVQASAPSGASAASQSAAVPQQPAGRGVKTMAGGIGGMQLVNNCDKKERRIVEIRIFYDDQTWETFVPKK